MNWINKLEAIAAEAGSHARQDLSSRVLGDEAEDLTPQFYVQKGLVNTRSIRHPRFHVTDKDDLSKLACNKLKLSECEPLGPDAPDVSIACGLCKKRRTDIWPIVL